MRIEQQIEDLTAEKARKVATKPADINTVLNRVRYFVAHLDKLVFEIIKASMIPMVGPAGLEPATSSV